MSSLKNKKSKLHWTHLIAVAVLAFYFIVSKINLAHAFLNSNMLKTFTQLFIFGTVFSFVFLYIFSHEKFFPFAKEIEKKEEAKEKNYLKRYLKHGKIFATFLIGVIGGPVFLSITTRLLLNNFRFRYLFVAITSFVSTIVTLSAGKGLFLIFN